LLNLEIMKRWCMDNKCVYMYIYKGEWLMLNLYLIFKLYIYKYLIISMVQNHLLLHNVLHNNTPLSLLFFICNFKTNSIFQYQQHYSNCISYPFIIININFNLRWYEPSFPIKNYLQIYVTSRNSTFSHHFKCAL
jgi:hypothetical protein